MSEARERESASRSGCPSLGSGKRGPYRHACGRGEDGFDWITSVDSSSKARSIESLPPAGRPSRAPRASHSQHARHRSLHIRDAQGEMKSLHGSPLKNARGRAPQCWIARPDPISMTLGEAATGVRHDYDCAPGEGFVDQPVPVRPCSRQRATELASAVRCEEAELNRRISRWPTADGRLLAR